MSGQYPSGYNSPLGGHRGQFNPQQQSPQMMNPLNQISAAGGGMGQNTMPVGSGGPGASGMMPMGGYHQQQQQQMPGGMVGGLVGPGAGMMGTTGMNMPPQQQLPHGPPMATGGMMNVGAAGGMNAGNLMQQSVPGPQMGAGMPQQQQQIGPGPGTSGAGLMHGPVNTGQAPQTSSTILTMSQPNPHKEINIVALSRLGQETVQDITSRFQEIFAALKIIQPTANRDNNTEKKVQEYFRTIRLLFKRVRIIYEKCNDGYPQGMEYTHVESLIPYKDEPEHRIEPSQCDEYRKALQENQELIETVRLKNRQLREIIDRTRIIIWEINTMLSMRRS